MENSNILTSFGLPKDLRAERSLLGAIILDGRDAYARVADIVTPDCFMDPETRTVFTAIKDLYDEGVAIDLVTVCSRLRGSIEFSYLIELSTLVSSSMHIEHYATTLSGLKARRMLITRSLDLYNRANDTETDIDELMDQAKRTLQEIGDATSAKSEFVCIGDDLDAALEEMRRRNEARRSGVSAVGIPTGLQDLNAITGGWRGSTLNIIGGRPGMGKTAMMLHFAKSAAQNRHPVLIFSLEMSARELTDRYIVGISDIDPNDYKRGEMTSGDISKVNNCIQLIRSMPIFVNERPYVTTAYIRRQVKQMRRKGLCNMVMIDYLQLIAESVDKGRNREQAVAAITRDLKVLAKEENVPIVLLCQLSRECERRADRKPILADLRESGAIEQDADMVMFLYRPSEYNITNEATGEPLPKEQGYIIIDKHRNGEKGLVPFRNNLSMTQISDCI